MCGEWSFDVHDDAEARAGATFVDPTPVATPAVPGVPRQAESGGGAVRHREGKQSAPAVPAPIPPAPPLRSLRTPIIQRAVAPPTPLPALAELKSIHDAHPGDVKTAIALANALDKRGNIEGALSVLMRAMDAGADGVVCAARARPFYQIASATTTPKPN